MTVSGRAGLVAGKTEAAGQRPKRRLAGLRKRVFQRLELGALARQ
ncbi:hypothetical protein [Mesorhizobium sp. M1329]